MEAVHLSSRQVTAKNCCSKVSSHGILKHMQHSWSSKAMVLTNMSSYIKPWDPEAHAALMVLKGHGAY